MTCREKLAIEHPEKIDPNCDGGCYGCPSHRGYLSKKEEKTFCINSNADCTACWDQEIPGEKIIVEPKIPTNVSKETETLQQKIYKACGVSPENILSSEDVKKACESLGYDIPDIPPLSKPIIKDSGNRREFDSGAVRDMAEGKGRCDLMPLDVVGTLLGDTVYTRLEDFLRTGDTTNLYIALSSCGVFHDLETMILEVAKHFEEGCKKYGENNWRRGIPVKFYIDSAVRHYLKFRRGDKDEPHDRAFCWNILCAIWTHDHKPELRVIQPAEEPKTK